MGKITSCQAHALALLHAILTSWLPLGITIATVREQDTIEFHK